MLDIAWPELVVIGAVALVAIGPKDLPKVMHALGRWAGKARGVMRDVQRTFEQLDYETEIAEKLRKEEQTHPPPSAATETKTDHDRTAP
jgi:sec-independent protein translocase protein TatB